MLTFAHARNDAIRGGVAGSPDPAGAARRLQRGCRAGVAVPHVALDTPMGAQLIGDMALDVVGRAMWMQRGVVTDAQLVSES